MGKALKTIKTEHRNLGKVLRCLAAEVTRLRDTKRKPDLELLHSIMYYIRVFPDRYHHPKEEEDYLFKALRQRRPDAAPVLDDLRSDHDRFSGLLGEVEAVLRHYDAHYPDGLSELEKVVQAYLDFQWRHMKEEEQILPLAQEALRREDWECINHAFARNNDPLFGEHLKVGFEALCDHIARHVSDELE